MRPVNVSAGKAKDYYYEKDPIFNKDDKSNGTWAGKGAEMLGLTGEIKKEDFEKIVEGRDPRTGADLVEGAGPNRERALTDIPLSDPKSVSIVAHVLKDERLHENKAALQTIDYLEKHYAYCRQTENGVTRDVQTSNFVVALYKHSIARVDKTQDIKIPDPQNHIHACLMNTTYNKEAGKWHATYNDQIFKDQKFITQVYNSFRAIEVKNLGYAIDVKQNGSFEIRGVPQEVIDLFSKRSTGMDKVTEELKKKFPNMSEAEIRNKISVFENRLEKNTNLTENQLEQSHSQQMQAMGHTKDSVKENVNAESLKSVEVQKDIVKMNEYDCVRTAAKALIESESAFTKTELLSAASKFGMGNHTPESLDKAFNELQKDGEFVNLYENKTYSQESVYSTPEQDKIEKENVQIAKDGQGTMNVIMTKEEVQKGLQNEKYKDLTRDQRGAIEHALTNQDRFTLIVGDAGTGKTTLMNVVREQAESHGYQVIGLSKTNVAVQELQAGAGINSKTLDSFLLKGPEKAISYAPAPGYGDTYKVSGRNTFDKAINEKIFGKNGERNIDNIISSKVFGPDSRWDIDHQINLKIEQGLNAVVDKFSEGKVYVVDEAGTIGAKEFNQFLSKIGEQDRVLLVGDYKQFASISAGKPMHDLLESGLKYVEMKETKRFKNDVTKEVAEKLANKEIDKAVEKLEQNNKISEISNREDRLNAIVKDYLSTDKNTIIITNTNADRHELNDKIRKGLQEQGKVSKEEYTFTVRDPKNLNPVEKHFSQNYEKGEHIFVNKMGLEGTRLGTEARIIEVNQDKNSLTVETRTGKTLDIDLHKDGDKISVYAERETKFSEGDKIIFTKNDKEAGVVNGTQGTITEIDKHGNITYEDKKGEERRININDTPYLSHAYAVTTYKSQGATFDRAIINSDTTNHVDFNSFYVSASRAREDIQVYTDSKEILQEKAQHETQKESTLEYQKDQNKKELENYINIGDGDRITIVDKDDKGNIEAEAYKVSKDTEDNIGYQKQSGQQDKTAMGNSYLYVKDVDTTTIYQSNQYTEIDRQSGESQTAKIDELNNKIDTLNIPQTDKTEYQNKVEAAVKDYKDAYSKADEKGFENLSQDEMKETIEKLEEATQKIEEVAQEISKEQEHEQEPHQLEERTESTIELDTNEQQEQEHEYQEQERDEDTSREIEIER